MNQVSKSILTLNCQGGVHAKLRSQLKNFFQNTLDTGTHDFLLLQEANPLVFELLPHPAYKTVRVFDREAEQESELCIIYRSQYTVSNIGFKSFAPLQYRKYQGGFKCPTFGALWADINTGTETIRLVSLHLHSDTDRRLRLAELQIVKELAYTDISIPTVIAGDFNSVFPGETAKLAAILAPEFTWMTENRMKTLDSRYCNNGPSLMTRISSFLGRFNIGISFHTDHFFVSRAIADTYVATCGVLSDRVSDHSPVTLLLRKMKS